MLLLLRGSATNKRWMDDKVGACEAAAGMREQTPTSTTLTHMMLDQVAPTLLSLHCASSVNYLLCPTHLISWLNTVYFFLCYLLLKNIVTTHIDDTKEKKLCSKEVSVSKNY